VTVSAPGETVVAGEAAGRDRVGRRLAHQGGGGAVVGPPAEAAGQGGDLPVDRLAGLDQAHRREVAADLQPDRG
jgi:hypothetical protein